MASAPRIVGLEDPQARVALWTWLQQQAGFNQLTTATGPGAQLQLRLSAPEIIETTWRGYRVRATAFHGEIVIACRKNT